MANRNINNLPSLTQRPSAPPKRVARLDKPLTARVHAERLRAAPPAPAPPLPPGVHSSLQLTPRPGDGPLLTDRPPSQRQATGGLRRGPVGAAGASLRPPMAAARAPASLGPMTPRMAEGLGAQMLSLGPDQKPPPGLSASLQPTPREHHHAFTLQPQPPSSARTHSENGIHHHHPRAQHVESGNNVATTNGTSSNHGGAASSTSSHGPSAYGAPPFTHGNSFTGEEVLMSFADVLTEYERAEIREVERVWWDGHTAVKHKATLLPGELNHGYDDDRGDYTITVHDHLAYRYEILGIVGKGSFGQVVKAYDHKEGRLVAIKVIRNKARFHKQALVEVKVLTHIKENDPKDETNSVRMHEHFSFRSHLCIVFELLSFNLYEFMKSNSFMGVSLPLIRRFAVQLLNTLRYLAKHSIVHCDLKPENILLCQPGRSAIKCIDFGSSCFEQQPVYTYIQSRFYRSPEVILGLPYFCAIDMWSFGCILAELYSGYPLFPGENEVEQLACIMEVLGTPPANLIAECSRRKQFFDSEMNPRIVANSKGKKRRPSSKDLISSLRCTDVAFVSFLEGCLQWDAAERLTPEAALRHEWIMEAGNPGGGVSTTSGAVSGGHHQGIPPPNGRANATSSRGRPLGSARAREAASSNNGGANAGAAGGGSSIRTHGFASELESSSARAAAREVAALGGGGACWASATSVQASMLPGPLPEMPPVVFGGGPRSRRPTR